MSASIAAKRTGRLGACALAFGMLIPLSLATILSSRANGQAVANVAHDAKDITGNWQGSLKTPQDTLRLILQVTTADKGFSGKMYSIDQGGQAINTVVSLEGTAVKFTVPLIGATYQGTESADGNTLTGTWNQGGAPMPLDLVRARKENAWEIPPPPVPPKLMAADANPSFDVATIKPNDSGATSMQGLTVNGRNFATRNSSLGDLISFAYQVQMKQVVGAPDWINKDRYDIAAVPDQDGAPNPQQVRLMIQKLLADRFKLTFHKDTRDLSAYVLTVGKGGSKLTPTDLKGPLPGIGFRPTPAGLSMGARNAAIGDFTGFLQSLVLDRPVVDRTGLPGRYDFTVTFTADESEFNGHPPPMPARTEGTEAAPGLFEALSQQLGLKLEAQKTAVDVIAIDHVEKPSAN